MDNSTDDPDNTIRPDDYRVCSKEGGKFKTIAIQWRIYIVKFWTHAPPLGVQILSISCSFWENLAKSYVGAPPRGVGAPSSEKS